MMDIKTRNSGGWLILGLALAATGWVVYDTTLRFRGLHTNDQVFNFGETTVNADTNKELSMQAVIDAHLFGVEPVKTEVVAKPAVVNAPKTRLKLTLTGLISGASSDQGYAVIEIARGETGVVAVGSEIGKTGAKLHSIEQDYILIDHLGKIEKLQLERETLDFKESMQKDSITVKQLNLSEAELAVLTAISQPTEEQPRFQNEAYLNQAAIPSQQPVPGQQIIQDPEAPDVTFYEEGELIPETGQ